MTISDTAALSLRTLVDTTARSIGCLWPSRKKQKRLLVRESAALGDRRFVAVVQFERKRFLIGVSPASITLLAALPDDDLIGDAD